MARFSALFGFVAAIVFALSAQAAPGPAALAEIEKRDILGPLFNAFGTKLITHINGKVIH